MIVGVKASFKSSTLFLKTENREKLPSASVYWTLPKEISVCPAIQPITGGVAFHAFSTSIRAK